MKRIQGFDNRDSMSHTYFEDHGFVYELIPDYGRFPAEFEFTMYSGGYCDREDNLYLFSRNPEHPIMQLDPEGNYVRSFGKGLFKEVHSLTVSPRNTLLCTDTALHVVRELSADGELIRDFGNLGVPSDSGYDREVWRHRMRKGKIVATDLEYERGWAFWMAIETIKRAAPPFNRPTGVCCTSNGEMFVSDGYGNAAVHRFDRDGKLLRHGEAPETSPGSFMCRTVSVQIKKIISG